MTCERSQYVQQVLDTIAGTNSLESGGLVVGEAAMALAAEVAEAIESTHLPVWMRDRAVGYMAMSRGWTQGEAEFLRSVVSTAKYVPRRRRKQLKKRA